MATAKKISQLTAVATPAGTDTLPVVQGGTTKKLTVTQLLTLQDAVIATISQADAEAGTATDVKLFTAQRVKQAIDALAGTAAFVLRTTGATMTAGDKVLITAATAQTMTIAATIAALDEFTVHNASTSAGVVSIEPNTGHTVKGAFGTAVGDTDTIVLAPGESITMVAVDTAVLEIV
jgi:hypothetical protein